MKAFASKIFQPYETAKFIIDFLVENVHEKIIQKAVRKAHRVEIAKCVLGHAEGKMIYTSDFKYDWGFENDFFSLKEDEEVPLASRDSWTRFNVRKAHRLQSLEKSTSF